MMGVRARAAWAKRLLLVTVGVTVVAFVTEIQEYRQPLEATWLSGAMGFVQLLVLVLTAIAFIRWFHAAYAALPTIRVRQRHKQWWAIGGWLIPIANLFRPKQIADEIWLADHRRRAAVPTYVHVWWGLFIVGSLAGNAAGRLYAGADTAGEVRTALWVFFVTDAIDVVAALLAHRLVEESTQGLEHAALEHAASAQNLAAPAPA